MPLITSRFRESADVRINTEMCTRCGLCVRVCKGAPLHMQEGEIRIDQTRIFGCIGCGQCVAVCPQAAIHVEGRDLTESDVIPLPPEETRASCQQLQALLLSRRSVRNFQNRPVEQELIDKILAAASTAPMGLPPSDVGVVVFNGRDKVQALRQDLLAALRRMRGFFSPLMLALMRPLMGREASEAMAAFAPVVASVYLHPERYENQDLFLYDAPLAMFFYASACADPVDPIIPATYSMLAAHALGLGTCMLGVPAVLMKMNKGLRRKYCGKVSSNPGILIIFGHPEVQYCRALTRRLASVKYA